MIFSRSKTVFTVVVMLGLVGSRVSAADGGTVMSPIKRQEALDKARKLLATRDSPPVTVDPFHSESFLEMVSGLNRAPGVAAPVNVVVAGPRTDRDILQSIAASLKPSGNFVMNGEPTLVFGQKRVKSGGFLTITFEGTEYTLEITTIERTSFTLRLNREEFTRPIK